MLNTIKKYASLQLTALVIGILLFSGYKIHTLSYDAGYNKANNAWVKKAGEYKDKINTLYASNVDMSQRIDVLTTQDTSKREEVVKVVTKKVIEYRDKPESKVQGLDDTFIDTYNESLGVKQ